MTANRKLQLSSHIMLMRYVRLRFRVSDRQWYITAEAPQCHGPTYVPDSFTYSSNTLFYGPDTSRIRALRFCLTYRRIRAAVFQALLRRCRPLSIYKSTVCLGVSLAGLIPTQCRGPLNSNSNRTWRNQRMISRIPGRHFSNSSHLVYISKKMRDRSKNGGRTVGIKSI